MQPGLRIGASGPTASRNLVTRFRKLPTAIISDSMLRLNGGGANLRPIGLAALCASALTVKTAPGDNLLVHKALDLAKPGEVIVVDAGGDLTNAIIGERMVKVAEARGIAGLVIYGAVRDSVALRNSPVPVFALGVNHQGPYKNGPGEINYPIALGGMIVRPGDLIIGDEDGLICVRLEDAAEICAEAERRFDHENRVDPCAEKRDWIDTKLRALGCDYSPAVDQFAK